MLKSISIDRCSLSAVIMNFYDNVYEIEPESYALIKNCYFRVVYGSLNLFRNYLILVTNFSIAPYVECLSVSSYRGVTKFRNIPAF